MDNLQQTDPTGGESVTPTGGESQPVETQPEVQAPEGQPEGAGAEGVVNANPWDDNPKFKGKSPADVYKAYQAAEKQLGSLGQKAEVANLIQERYGVTPEQFRQIISQQEQAQHAQEVQANPISYLQNELQSTKSEIALMKEEKALELFLKENPAYEPFKDKLFKLAFTAETDKPYEDIAQEYFGSAIAQGQQSAYQKIETKKQTQATGVSNAQATKPDISQMSVEELEQVLPHA